jgi:L-malate glycosyltransferase
MSMISVAAVDESKFSAASNASLPHVLLVLDQIPKTLGGGERIVLKLAAALPQYGFRVSILTFSVHPQSSGIESPPCPIYVLPLRRTYDFKALKAAFDLRQFIDVQEIQIVQTFFESADLWAGFVTKAMSRAKLIWSRRDMGILRDRKHKVAYRLLARAPDAVFAVSEEVRRHCIDVDRIDSSRVKTVHNGLDIAAWENISRPPKLPGGFFVATVGNIRRVKGHDVFVKAAGLIAPLFPKVTFSVAGDILEPDYFAELQTLVRELRLTDRFHFDGGVTDLNRYLSAADIFVLPSRSEGFSNAIVEAMAASLPVVATRVGGNAEAVKEGITGLLVPPDDPEALSAAITHLLADPVQAKAMGVEGKNVASRNFTTEAMVTKIVETYEKLLNTGHRRSIHD